MRDTLDALKKELIRDKDAKSAAKNLFKTLTDAIAANINDPAELKAILAEYTGSIDELTADIVANTPAGPVVPA